MASAGLFELSHGGGDRVFAHVDLLAIGSRNGEGAFFFLDGGVERVKIRLRNMHGGFGVIACGAMTVDLLDKEIAATKERTDRPFGVNLIVHKSNPRLQADLGVPLGYTGPAEIRTDIAKTFGAAKELEGIANLQFGRTLAAQHWLQASNPSERWKWNFLFQDLPPVKGTVELSSLPMPPGAIPLKEVK